MTGAAKASPSASRQAREQLEFLGRPLRTLAPGQYRAYLAPAALEEIMGMLSWGGFSAQSIASKSSPLQKLYVGDQRVQPAGVAG